MFHCYYFVKKKSILSTNLSIKGGKDFNSVCFLEIKTAVVYNFDLYVIEQLL